MNFLILRNPEAFMPVKLMAESCYATSEEATVVFGYNNYPFGDFKRDGKLIVYQLEQLYNNGSQWYNPNHRMPRVRDRTRNIHQWLTAADEIWDYDLDNIEFLKELGFKNVQFKPILPCDALKFSAPEQPKIYDLLFFGTLNARRAIFLNQIKRALPNIRLKIIGVMPEHELRRYRLRISPPCHGIELEQEILKARAVLNIHYYESKLQEQVRIAPLLANNIPVISEKSRRNYFGDAIVEFTGVYDFVEKYNHIMDKGKPTKNTWKIGAAYNTFYGLELIEKSIASIAPVVDEIVIVHQRVSFSGEKESEETKEIIKRLQAKYHVIIYSTLGNHRDAVLTKRNAGLRYLKEKGCDFILPMDADERFDASQLRAEIRQMIMEGTDTLYCPIRTFYHDEAHYFTDSYYVPAVYRINERTFQKCASTVLCDPLRKMPEKKHRTSEMPMLHYSYLAGSYGKKKSKISNVVYRNEYEQIREHLGQWKPGQKALVFGNHPRTGEQILVYRDLKKIDLLDGQPAVAMDSAYVT